MQAIELFRQELIDSGQASKILLDYIDDRIQQIIANELSNIQGQLEEILLEKLKDIRT